MGRIFKRVNLGLAVFFTACTPNYNNSRIYTTQLPDSITKTFLDSTMHLRWSQNDCISIFESTYNQQYIFCGADGDNSGQFMKVKEDGFVTGNPIDKTYSVYPYSKENSISNEGILCFNYATTQNYRMNSFGVGANTMVAVTQDKSDNFLSFKNCCSYLVLDLYGNAAIKRICLKSNNGESLSGKATATINYGSDPMINIVSGIDSLILEFPNGPVRISHDASNPTAFWLTMPEATLSKGFTVYILDSNDNVTIMSSNKERILKRNIVNRMMPLEITMPSTFKDFCLRKFDSDYDGILSEDEAAGVTIINCSNLGFDSIEGISIFKNLKYLDVSKNNLENIDCHSNVYLDALICTGNRQLKEVILSRKPNRLDCDKHTVVSYIELKRPVFTIIDDDFILPYASKLKALCDSLDIKCDFALMPKFENGKVVLTNQQEILVQEYISQGYEFLLHPNHTCWYNDEANGYKFIDVQTCEKSLMETIDLFKLLNIEQKYPCVVYPGNSDFSGVRQMCARYTLLGFGTTGRFNLNLADPYNLERMMMRFNTWGKALTKQYMKEGADQCAWIIIGMHSWQYGSNYEFDDNSFSWTNLRDILEYAKTLGEFKTCSETISLFSDDD